MKESFVNRKSRAFFRGKKATLLRTQTSIGGVEIKENETVTLIGQHDKFKSDFNIETEDGREIHGIDCEYLELVKE